MAHADSLADLVRRQTLPIIGETEMVALDWVLGPKVMRTVFFTQDTRIERLMFPGSGAR